MNERTDINLTQQEKEFCELFVHGGYNEVGDAAACYKKAFGAPLSKATRAGSKLLNEPAIQEYITSIEASDDTESFEAKHLRKKITKRLLEIADRCAEGEYVDRKGNPISPASLRSVSVNAYKLVADLNGIKQHAPKESGTHGDSKGGITFNVIVPPQTSSEVKIEEASQPDATI